MWKWLLTLCLTNLLRICSQGSRNIVIAARFHDETLLLSPSPTHCREQGRDTDTDSRRRPDYALASSY